MGNECSWKDAGVIATSKSPFCKLKTIPVRAVKVKGFWEPRMRANREKSVMAMFHQLKEHGIIDNFLIASGRKTGTRRGPVFTDSDLYKWIEAAAFVLQSGPAPEISKAIDEATDAILPAQREDGYLNTFFAGERANQRYTNFHSNHEFYCAGHLIQGAITLYRATGDTRLLDCSRKFADHLINTFGPGKREDGYSGHPELEMAMVELYRTTGKKEYLDFVKYLLGKHTFSQLREMDPRRYNTTGHAVRAVYLCSGGADYYAETGDEEIMKTLEALWQDVVMHKMYITGGIGSRYEGETFGGPYELPNLRAYTETCAAIGNIMWNWRMLCVTGEARFADIMEKTLYNGFLSGVSLDGTKYFYVNPLTAWGEEYLGHWGRYERKPWFDCTCCPPNVERMFASLPGYFYTTGAEEIWVHLYGESNLDWHFADGKRIKLTQKTAYPWDGKIEITLGLDSSQKFALFLRIPGWCKKSSITINGKKVKSSAPGTYQKLQREWKNGDKINLEFDMPVVIMDANPRIESDRCAVAIQRGPVVYCIESVDNPGVSIMDAKLILNKKSSDKDLSVKFEPGLLGGVVTVKAKISIPSGKQIQQPLYMPLGTRKIGSTRKVSATFIPYYSWANRGPSQMQGWFPYQAT